MKEKILPFHLIIAGIIASNLILTECTNTEKEEADTLRQILKLIPTYGMK